MNSEKLIADLNEYSSENSQFGKLDGAYDICTSDIYINCPESDFGQCKELGGKYDTKKCAWYIPVGHNTRKFFNRWEPICKHCGSYPMCFMDYNHNLCEHTLNGECCWTNNGDCTHGGPPLDELWLYYIDEVWFIPEKKCLIESESESESEQVCPKP